MKKCTTCKIIKSDIHFHIDSTRSDKLSNKCKICRSKYQRNYYLNHLDKIKNRDLKKNYGISIEERNQKQINQDNKCLICHKDFLLLNKKDIHVDHDHSTGKIRGILCKKCNSMIGLANDNILILSNAINYLKLK